VGSGVNIHKVSRWMGHARIGITLDRYAHLLPDEDGSDREQTGRLTQLVGTRWARRGHIRGPL
jgi:hypothetical protein